MFFIDSSYLERDLKQELHDALVEGNVASEEILEDLQMASSFEGEFLEFETTEDGKLIFCQKKDTKVSMQLVQKRVCRMFVLKT